MSDAPEDKSSENAALQCSFQHCLVRGWRFCHLIPGIHEKSEGKGEGCMPLKTSWPASQPCSFTVVSTLVMAHVLTAAALIRENGQNAAKTNFRVMPACAV